MSHTSKLVLSVAALVALGAFALPVGAAGAEPGDPESIQAMRAELLALQERLRDLEARLARAVPEPEPAVAAEGAETELAESVPESAPPEAEAIPRSRAAAFLPSRGWLEGMSYGIPGMQLGIHGFIDTEYIDSGPDGARGGDSTFDSHHANLFVRAQMRPNLLAHAEFEFEHSGDIVHVDQAYVAWAVKDFLTLEAGRFYTPFGIERFVWYSPTNLLISRPEPMRQILPGNFYANGLMAAGLLGRPDGQRFSYEVALSNGLGNEADVSRRGSRQDRDNNDDKALTGRVAWIPVPNLEIGASYHDQRYDDAGELDFTAYGADLGARWRGWQIRGEYVDAAVERLGVPDLDQSGWYGQVAYTFAGLRELLPDLTLVTRYDVVDLDESSTGNDDQELWSLGVNASIYDHFRVKLEHRFASEDGPSRDDDTLYAQVVVDF